MQQFNIAAIGFDFEQNGLEQGIKKLNEENEDTTIQLEFFPGNKLSSSQARHEMGRQDERFG